MRTRKLVPSRASSLSWLVFNDSDIEIARHFIDSLDTSDATVDTLGLGVVLESLSDAFFPATSTLHRRVRYQIFVPALVWFLQRRGYGSNFRPALKKIEYDLQRALVDSGETRGVIGRTRKEALKYWPSLLYWNATNTLQMLGKDSAYSMDEVSRILDELNEKLVNDDKELESPASGQPTSIKFEPEFEAIAEGLFESRTRKLRHPMTFRLTTAEARYLKNKLHTLFPKSLTSYLLKRTSASIDRIESLFELTATPHTDLNELVRQAELFSCFSMGATYAYRWVLCEHLRMKASGPASGKDRAKSRDCAEAHFARWRRDSPHILKWSYTELVRAASAFSIDLEDHKLDRLQRQVLEAARFGGSTRHALEGLKKPLRGHEREIKGNASRFENSNISIPKNVFAEDYGGPFLFDYRWSRVSKVNALDIVRALEGK